MIQQHAANLYIQNDCPVYYWGGMWRGCQIVDKNGKMAIKRWCNDRGKFHKAQIKMPEMEFWDRFLSLKRYTCL